MTSSAIRRRSLIALTAILLLVLAIAISLNFLQGQLSGHAFAHSQVTENEEVVLPLYNKQTP